MDGDYYNEELGINENPVDHFLNEMNLMNEILLLKNSHFDSPHGLANKDNVYLKK